MKQLEYDNAKQTESGTHKKMQIRRRYNMLYKCKSAKRSGESINASRN